MKKLRLAKPVLDRRALGLLLEFLKEIDRKKRKSKKIELKWERQNNHAINDPLRD